MWYPMGGKQSAFQPFVGIRVNYTCFWDEEVDKQLEAALGVITEPVTGSTDPVPADLDLDDSWGVAARAGFDYLINDNRGVNAGVWWIDIDTDPTIETDLPTWVLMWKSIAGSTCWVFTTSSDDTLVLLYSCSGWNFI